MEWVIESMETIDLDFHAFEGFFNWYLLLRVDGKNIGCHEKFEMLKFKFAHIMLNNNLANRGLWNEKTMNKPTRWTAQFA